MNLGRAPAAVVIDASVAVSLLAGDDDWARRWSTWADEGAILLAPAHFRAEVANALLRSLRLPAANVAVALERIERAGVEIADRQLGGLLDAVSLADTHGLTVYDALYLQLALDVDGELATLDDKLGRAAAAENVAVTE